MRLLLVEDDLMIGESVQKGLRQDGFAVDWVHDGQAAELALENDVYDLVVLDLGLPRKDGLDVLSGLRAKGNSVPVLILTARDGVPQRVQGLDRGADDYLVKPFDLDELSARIRALLRRRAGRAEPRIRHGDLVLNPVTHEASMAGKPLMLSCSPCIVRVAAFRTMSAMASRARFGEPPSRYPPTLQKVQRSAVPSL